MTAALPPRREGWTPGLEQGCTACGSQDTARLCGCHGRRCDEHPAHHPYRNRLMGGMEFCGHDGHRWPCAQVEETE